MPKYLPVVDKPGLFRDTESNGIINKNQQQYRDFQRAKLLRQKREAENKAAEERLNNLEKKVNNLENGIKQILEILTNGNRSC